MQHRQVDLFGLGQRPYAEFVLKDPPTAVISVQREVWFTCGVVRGDQQQVRAFPAGL